MPKCIQKTARHRHVYIQPKGESLIICMYIYRKVYLPLCTQYIITEYDTYYIQYILLYI